MGLFGKCKIKSTTDECIDSLISKFKVKYSGNMEELNIENMIFQLENLFETATFSSKMDKPPIREGQSVKHRFKDLLINYSWGYVRSQGVKIKNNNDLDKIKEEIDNNLYKFYDLL